MRVLTILATVSALASASAAAAESLDAHEHGHAELTVAIEGATVAIELHAPGATLVGFEYAATTAEETAAVEAAKADLAEPLALFALSPEAGCAVDTADVELEAEGAHNEYHAAYRLTCATPDALAQLDAAAFFARFEKAEEIEVAVSGPSGQTGAELEKGAPTVALR